MFQNNILKEKYHYKDFTEANYRRLIKIANNNFKFIFYDKYKKPGSNILWRHDVDFSMHRAHKLAKIEAEENVKCTYFLNLHSNFYNLLEEEISSIVTEIIDLGHQIGIHWDSSFYYNLNIGHMHENMKMEKIFLEKLFNVKINSISFHNPDISPVVDINSEIICGMINAYSKYIFDHYKYCSDSNGYWRFERLEDILINSRDTSLQVLTHPAWWTPHTMSPRNRVSRCISGRSKKQHLSYDSILEKSGRENIGRYKRGQ